MDLSDPAAAIGPHAARELFAARAAARGDMNDLDIEQFGERLELVACDPPGPDNRDDPAVFPREVSRCKARTCTRAQIGEIARLHYGTGITSSAVKQSNDARHARQTAPFVLIEIGDHLDPISACGTEETGIEDCHTWRVF